MGRKRHRDDVLQWSTHLQIFEKFLRDYAEAQDKGDVFFGECVYTPSSRPPRAVAFYPLPVHKPDPADAPYTPAASEFHVEEPDYDLLKCHIPVPQILSVSGVIPPPLERLPESARNIWKVPAKGIPSSLPSPANTGPLPANSEQEYDQVAKMRKAGKPWAEISKKFPTCPLTTYKRRYNQALKEEKQNASKPPTRQTSINSQASHGSSSATNPNIPRGAGPALNLSANVPAATAPLASTQGYNAAGVSPWLGGVFNGLGVVGGQWPNAESARSSIPVGAQLLAGVAGNPALAATIAGWPNTSAISRLGGVSTAGGWSPLAASAASQGVGQHLAATVAAAAVAATNRGAAPGPAASSAPKAPQLGLGQQIPTSAPTSGGPRAPQLGIGQQMPINAPASGGFRAPQLGLGQQMPTIAPTSGGFRAPQLGLSQNMPISAPAAGGLRPPQLGLSQHMPNSAPASSFSTGGAANTGNLANLNVTRMAANGMSNMLAAPGGGVANPSNLLGLRALPQATNPAQAQDVTTGSSQGLRPAGPGAADPWGAAVGGPSMGLQAGGTRSVGAEPAAVAQPPVVTTSQPGLSLPATGSPPQGSATSPGHAVSTQMLSERGVPSSNTAHVVDRPTSGEPVHEEASSLSAPNTQLPSTSNHFGALPTQQPVHSFTPHAPVTEPHTRASTPGFPVSSIVGQFGDPSPAFDQSSSASQVDGRSGREWAPQSQGGVRFEGVKALDLGQHRGGNMGEAGFAMSGNVTDGGMGATGGGQGQQQQGFDQGQH